MKGVLGKLQTKARPENLSGMAKYGMSVEARILAAMVDDPTKPTEEQMADWVRDIDFWDVCDQVCMNLFEKRLWIGMGYPGQLVEVETIG